MWEISSQRQKQESRGAFALVWARKGYQRSSAFKSRARRCWETPSACPLQPLASGARVEMANWDSRTQTSLSESHPGGAARVRRKRSMCLRSRRSCIWARVMGMSFTLPNTSTSSASKMSRKGRVDRQTRDCLLQSLHCKYKMSISSEG